MRLMGKRSQAGDRQFTQVTVVKTRDADIFRNMKSRIGEFFDQPVGDFVIMADNGGTGTQISFYKIRKKSGILFFFEVDELLGREPGDRIFIGRPASSMERVKPRWRSCP